MGENFQLFENQPIRAAWDAEKEEWYFSVVDVVGASWPGTFEENKKVAKRGGSIAGNARKELEEELGQPVLTSKNASELNAVVLEMIETVANIDDKKKDE